MKYQKYIDEVNNALSWIKEYRPNDYERRFLELVEERRKLLKLQNADNDNPAIAAFGRSQVGKSYLMSCILQDKGNSFKVKAAGVSYDFIKAINPPGNGKEATGVVTRFSSFSRCPELYDEECPILAKVFSLVDIIIIICDTYYNDFRNFALKSDEDIKKFADELYQKYKTYADNSDAKITADDILNIKEYFKNYINNAQSFVKLSFFDRIALVINKIPKEEYINIFSILWNDDKHLSGLYNRLYTIISKIEFKRYIYLPVEAVVHNATKENTIMSVWCLKHLYDVTPLYSTDVYIKDGESLKCACNLSKSDICAICMEVIYKIDDSFLLSSAKYDFENIDAEVRSKLTTDEIKMSILRDNDLLDFPGARSRKKMNTDTLSDTETILEGYLRGKIAYLFNKYNESLAINILLYCHHDEQNDVADLPILLEEWVKKYVGKTSEKRRETLERTGGISPLFYIGTMFNKDMALNANEIENNENGVKGRWDGRFATVLFGQCFGSVDWVKNWTGAGVKFKNSYLLRDYKYSGENASQLYKGFRENGREDEMMIPQNYYDMMRKTFIENETVNDLFPNPALSWDVAASINNDGSLYIIENLSIVAEKMLANRNSQFAESVIGIKSKLHSIMKGYYVPNDKSEILEENIDKAFCVSREFDFTCKEDDYFFGHFLQALQMSESECYNDIHSMLPELGQVVCNPDVEIILDRCRDVFVGCKEESDYWNAFMRVYRFRRREDAEQFLRNKGVSAESIFNPSRARKTNSYVIADKIMNRWLNKIKSVDVMNAIAGDTYLDQLVLNDLIENIASMAIYIDLVEHIDASIAQYVNVVKTDAINESFVADIIVTIINDFVVDLGYSLLNDTQREGVEKVVKAQNLPVYDYINKERKSFFSEDELADIFNDIVTSGKALTPGFKDNYNRWLEYMFISFIANINLPDCDPIANTKVSNILKNLTD